MTPTRTSSDVVIVGASLAGLTTAEALRAERFGGRITLIGKEPHAPYSRPPLSKQVLAGTWSHEQTVLCTPAALDALDVRFMHPREATALDPAARIVRLGPDHVSYDTLVIATGVTARRLDGFAHLSGVHALRTVDDVLALKDELGVLGGSDAASADGTPPRVVVVGGGVLGSEIASAIRSLGMPVTMISRRRALRLGQSGDALSPLIAALLREHGVDLRLGVDVAALLGEDHVAGVSLSDGSIIEADVVITAIGCDPDTQWLAGSGLDLSDGVVCDATGEAAPHIFAVGDVACWRDSAAGAAVRAEHQLNAIEQARAVGRLIATGERPGALVPFFWSEVFDTKIQVYGQFLSGAELQTVAGSATATNAKQRFVAASVSAGRVTGVVGWNLPREFRHARALVGAASASLSPVTAASAPGCPFNAAHTLPHDGTPLTPSPLLARLRGEAPASQLTYADQHEGWLVTRYDLARSVLDDERFSQSPQRLPLGPASPPLPDVDEAGRAALAAANLLSLDGEQHAKMRRSVVSRFSARSVRGYRETIARVVSEQLDRLRASGSPANLMAEYAEPISAAMHCHVLGVPPHRAERFATLFVGESTAQAKFDFIRHVLNLKRDDLGDDVLSDLLRSDLSSAEIEGVVLVLMTSGRDSVAYMIATTTVALLTHPEQLAILREDPSLVQPAVEEFMRFGTMFLTVFPRTAREDVTLEGVTIRAGQTVSVSPVAANRDERRFGNPDVFDVTRDAFGHLGFGHGQHGCMGQQLARAEIREAITQLITGIPDLFLVNAAQTHPLPFAHPVATYQAGPVVVGWG